MARKPAGYFLIGGFVVALACLVLWFALDLGGLMPGDSPASTPEEPATVLPQ